MKIKNIFKKKTQVTSANAQKLEKNQLSQIIGGGDDSTTADPTNIKYYPGGGKAQGVMGSKPN